MAVKTNLNTIHIFPSEESFKNNASSVKDNDISLVEYPDIDFVVETFKDGYSWYRKYKSGWIEQGGVAATLRDTRAGYIVITFIYPFADTGYVCLSFPRDGAVGISDVYLGQPYPTERTTTSVCHSWDGMQNDAASIVWYACGQGA